MQNFITRFAPSPTGLLHIGHAFSALTAFDAAKAAAGNFILRIEDIDQTRCKPEFEQAIFEDLAWLGVRWEKPVRRQSDYFDDYANALEKLREKGLVYRCFKTRKEIIDEIARAPHLPRNGPEGVQYTGSPLGVVEEQKLLAEGGAYAWRLSMSAAREHLGPAFDDLEFIEEGDGPNGETGAIKAMPEIFGDAVIGRKDCGTSYHLASVYDDALQGITHVIRGVDLYHAAHLHVLLQALLGFTTPRYRHHRLITDESGKRLAKRDRSRTLRALREDGQSAKGARAMLDVN